MCPTRGSLDQFVARLITEEAYDEEEGIWYFVDRSPCSVCITSASRVAREFDGQVFGYWSKMNPSAAIGEPLCEGHDFALVAHRWIVDYWAFRIAHVMSKPVLDLQSVPDGELSLQLFGQRDAWEALAV